MLAAAVCPHPPVLIPEVAAGAAPELAAVRSACAAAISQGLAADPAQVMVIGGGPETGEWAADAAGCLPNYGMPGRAGDLPLSLTVGRWLVRAAGWSGPLRLQAVGAATEPRACAALGAERARAERVLIVAMGDGSARRSVSAPGHLDPDAQPFDDHVADALAQADLDTLLGLEVEPAAGLLAAGRAAWQVLAGAARQRGGSWSGQLLAHEAPYGVGYFVATWRHVSS